VRLAAVQQNTKTYRELFSLDCPEDLLPMPPPIKRVRSDFAACSRLRAAALSNSLFTDPMVNTSAITQKVSTSNATNPLLGDPFSGPSSRKMNE